MLQASWKERDASSSAATFRVPGAVGESASGEEGGDLMGQSFIMLF